MKYTLYCEECDFQLQPEGGEVGYYYCPSCEAIYLWDPEEEPEYRLMQIWESYSCPAAR